MLPVEVGFRHVTEELEAGGLRDVNVVVAPVPQHGDERFLEGEPLDEGFVGNLHRVTCARGGSVAGGHGAPRPH